MLSVRLDVETKEHLAEILRREKLTRSEFVKRLINEYWERSHPSQTVLARRGGVPRHQLNSAGNLSERERRKLAVAARIHSNHRS